MTGPLVLARGVVARGAGAATTCPECGQDAVTGQACPECGQLAAPEGWTGVLTVATSIGGRRQVVTVERTPEGRWAPAELGRPGTIHRRRSGRQ